VTGLGKETLDVLMNVKNEMGQDGAAVHLTRKTRGKKPKKMHQARSGVHRLHDRGTSNLRLLQS
jgi:hypothetical protein